MNRQGWPHGRSRPIPKAWLIAAAMLTSAACGSTVTAGPQAAAESGIDAANGATSDGLGPALAGEDATDTRVAGDSGRVASPESSGVGAVSSAGTADMGSAAGPAPQTASGDAATQGRGYDAKRIYIGVPTIKDFDQTVGDVFGASLDSGDQEGNVKAIVAHINKRGGVLGRQLVPYFHDYKTAQALSDPSSTAAAICEDFTQDRPVAAVIDLTFTDGPQLWDCWKKAQIPAFGALFNMTDQQELDQFAPVRYAMGNNRTDSYFPVLLERQQELGYFKGWDTVNGQPGVAPVKVGMMYTSEVLTDKRNFERLRDMLEARGIDVVAMAASSGSNPSSISGAVLQFKSAGVTHVYMDYAGQGLLFMQNAENQGYRPRYAAWAHLSPGLMEQFAPARQLRGALGAGFSPYTDVTAAGSPGDVSAAAPLCRGMLTAAGLSYPRGSVAEGVAFKACDAIRLFAEATDVAKSPAAGAVRQALGVVGPGYVSATVFRNAFSAQRADASRAVRDLGYVDDCSCFRYLSNVNHPS